MLLIESSSISSVVHPYRELYHPAMEPTGFHLYSSHIARDPFLSVYRKFAVLSTRNILYLQSELADLEVQLQGLDAKGNGEEVDNDIWAISRSWRKMRDAGVLFQESKTAVENIQQSHDPREMRDAGLSFQESNTTVKNIQESQDPRNSWSVVLKIRSVLKEYSRLPQLGQNSSSTHLMLDEALQAQAWLQSLERPPKHVPEAMRKIPELDVGLRTSISAIDVEYLDLKNSQDIISLTPEHNREAFSRFLINKLSWVLLPTEARQEQQQTGFTVLSDNRVRRTTRVVAVVLASILPVLSIVILYYVHSTNIRIGLIIVFSTLFSAVVALVSDARNVEVMAATAAYAAVLVVFVSGNL